MRNNVLITLVVIFFKKKNWCQLIPLILKKVKSQNLANQRLDQGIILGVSGNFIDFLGECRGILVFLNRFSATKKGKTKIDENSDASSNFLKQFFKVVKLPLLFNQDYASRIISLLFLTQFSWLSSKISNRRSPVA